MLQIHDLKLSYGNNLILSDLNIPEIKGGGLIGVLGANGVGKSTLLRSLAALQGYEGSATLNNQELNTLSYNQRAGLIGYLPQRLPQKINLMAYEVVMSAYRALQIGKSANDIEHDVEEIFKMLGIYDLAFQTLEQMSGGQRQMVGLAQILVRQPKLLLLDEPTSALDLRWQLCVINMLKELVTKNNSLCLIAIHDINLALRHCDKVMLLADHKLRAFDVPEKAMTIKSLKATYGIDGRVERCSQGHTFIIADNVSA